MNFARTILITLLPLFAASAVGAQEAATEAVASTAMVPGSQIENMSEPLLRMVLSLSAVLGLVALCAWVARRLRTTQLQGGLIQIVSGLSLGPKEKVVLLRVGDDEILVGLSQAGMQPLHVLGAPTTPEKFSLDMGDKSSIENSGKSGNATAETDSVAADAAAVR